MITITETFDSWEITFPFSQQLVDTIKTLPKHSRMWSKEKRKWICTKDISEQDFTELFVNFDYEIKKLNAVPNISLPPSLNFLFPFQQDAVKKFYTAPCSLLAFDVGCGKTVTSLAIAIEKSRQNFYKQKIIVVCPKSIRKQWEQEINRFFPTQSVVIVDGKKENRLQQYWTADITICNYESFRLDVPDCSGKIIILDEASKIKNRDTQITKVLTAQGEKAVFKIALTATPIENSLINYYSILNFLSKNYMKWTEFSSKYVEWEELWIPGVNRVVKNIKGYKNLDLFKERTKNIMSRVKKEDVRKELPPLDIQWRFVEPTKTQQHMHDILIEKGESLLQIFTLLRVLEDSPLLFNESDSELLKTLFPTIAYEPIKDEGNKFDEISELMEEIDGKQTMLFTQFERFGNKLLQRLKKDYPNQKIEFISGATNQGDREKIIQDFKDGKIKWLISTNILSYGVSFQDVDFAVVCDLPLNPATLHQILGRIHRINSLNGKIGYIICGNLIEKDIYDILFSKQQLIENVMEGNENEDENKLMNKLRMKYNKK